MKDEENEVDDDDESVYPSVVSAVIDAVKRHPNLIEVALGRWCSESLSRGLVIGVLQKADVQTVDVKDNVNFHHHSKTIDAMSPTCECMRACIMLSCSSFIFSCCYFVYAHSVDTLNDMIQEYFIPAMQKGSLRRLAVRLEKNSSLESILRELPHANIEQLAIVLDYHYHYSEGARLL